MWRKRMYSLIWWSVMWGQACPPLLWRIRCLSRPLPTARRAEPRGAGDLHRCEHTYSRSVVQRGGARVRTQRFDDFCGRWLIAVHVGDRAGQIVIAERALGKIVTDQAPARRIHVADRGTAVNEVVVPDQGIALLRGEVLRRESVFAHERRDRRLVTLMVDAASGARLADVDTNLAREHVGQLVASGIIDQRAAVGGDVFERDPRRRKESER